jgi:hypothetical protein
LRQQSLAQKGKEDVGNPATYQIKGDEGYVRAEVIDSKGKVAWTQPVMIGKPRGRIK